MNSLQSEAVAVIPEMPEWAKRTPEVSYGLAMYSESAGNEEQIWMDRDEYIALKARLAEMRGIPHTLEVEEEEVAA